MTVAADLAGFPPNSWFAAPRLTREEARRGAVSWSGAVALHIALVLAAVLAIASQPPPAAPATIDTLSVEIVMSAPAPTAQPGADVVEEGPPAPEPAAAAPAPTRRFEVVLPNLVYTDMFREQRQAFRGEDVDAAPPGLPSGVRAALVMAHYCRSTAMGIAADLYRCPPSLDRFALESYVAAQARGTY